MPSQLDYSPFIMPVTPIVQPNAPRTQGPLDGLAEFMFALRKQNSAEEEAKRQEELKKQALAQEAQLAQQRDATTRYGYNLQEQGRTEQNTRLTETEQKKHIDALFLALNHAQATGDRATAAGIQQEIQRAGLAISEHPSNYAPPAPVDQGATPAPPAPGGSGPQIGDPNYGGYVRKPGDIEASGNPRAVNPSSGATGLFQATRPQDFGMTKDQLRGMSPEDQFGVAYPQYLANKGVVGNERQNALRKDPAENYLAIAAPALMGKPDDTVAYHEGGFGYKKNESWDINKDGKITAGEIRQRGREGGGGAMTLPADFNPRDLGDVDSPDFLKGVSRGTSSPSDQLDASGVPLPRRPAAEPPKAGGGLFRVTDPKTGKVVYEFDAPAIQAQTEDVVTKGMQSIMDSATTPEQKRAAQEALSVAKSMATSGQPTRDAVLEGIKQYRSSVGEEGKASRAAGGDEFKIAKQLQADGDKAIDQTRTQFAIPSLQKDEAVLDAGRKALEMSKGLGDVAAMRSWLKTVEGRATDADYNSVLNSQGLTGWLKRQINRADDGRFPPELEGQLGQILDQNKTLIQERRKMAAETAAQRVLGGSPYATPELRQQYADRARQALLGGAPAPAAGSGQTPSLSLDDLNKAMGQ